MNHKERCANTSQEQWSIKSTNRSYTSAASHSFSNQAFLKTQGHILRKNEAQCVNWSPSSTRTVAAHGELRDFAVTSKPCSASAAQDITTIFKIGEIQTTARDTFRSSLKLGEMTGIIGVGEVEVAAVWADKSIESIFGASPCYRTNT